MSKSFWTRSRARSREMLIPLEWLPFGQPINFAHSECRCTCSLARQLQLVRMCDANAGPNNRFGDKIENRLFSSVRTNTPAPISTYPESPDGIACAICDRWFRENKFRDARNGANWMDGRARSFVHCACTESLSILSVCVCYSRAL